MNYFFITLFVFAFVGVAMAIGFIVAKKELKGSCGGLGKIMGEDCMFCDKKEECDKDKEKKSECVKLECGDDGTVSLGVH